MILPGGKSPSSSLLLGAPLIVASCESPGPGSATPSVAQERIAALEAIEETRSAFQSALNAGRYAELGRYVTADAVTVAPGSEEWEEMRSLGADRDTPFPYDSISMHPRETVVVSDSVAWDFGVSVVYYTDAQGVVRELRDTFLAILMKGSDGVWRLHREVASARTNDPF